MTIDKLVALKIFAKRFLFEIGGLRLWHRFVNRRNLTVVMFHRVVPLNDSRFSSANPHYTITPDEFRSCLSFFKKFYSVVSLEQVKAACGGATLPPCPLLITFDDGWRDTLDYAAPVLREFDLPAVVFVSTGQLGTNEGYWQEDILRLADRGDLKIDEAIAICGGEDAFSQKSRGQKWPDAMVEKLNRIPPSMRRTAIKGLSARRACLDRTMLNEAELVQLSGLNFDIGGHGHSHDPLTEIGDIEVEIKNCRERLSNLPLKAAPESFSFPHGRYNRQISDTAEHHGFRMRFSSEPLLNSVDTLDGAEAIGRIEIDLSRLRTGNGFDSRRNLPELAMNLVLRPARRGPANE
ncbi:MAG: polysaccharide deacetylase family protein [Rhodobacteraceae bacterium]|nr:polysaccharide deacetylase family protein [Paracoccaceae bacterium]